MVGEQKPLLVSCIYFDRTAQQNYSTDGHWEGQIRCIRHNDVQSRAMGTACLGVRDKKWTTK